MAPAEDLIGTSIGGVVLPVEAGKVREFARALQDPNPVYRDVEAARAAGFPAIPAPPTFTVVAAHFQDEGGGLLEALGLDLARVLHGEQEWTFHRRPVVGDVLHGDTTVSGIETKPGKRGGQMRLVRLETVFRDADGEPVVTEASTVIETAAVVAGEGG